MSTAPQITPSIRLVPRFPAKPMPHTEAELQVFAREFADVLGWRVSEAKFPHPAMSAIKWYRIAMGGETYCDEAMAYRVRNLTIEACQAHEAHEAIHALNTLPDVPPRPAYADFFDEPRITGERLSEIPGVPSNFWRGLRTGLLIMLGLFAAIALCCGVIKYSPLIDHWAHGSEQTEGNR